MKMLSCAALTLAICLPASAVNFSGKWTLQSAGARGGRGGATVLTLVQVDSTVTGTITVRVDPGSNSPLSDEIWGGKADGDAITFYVWTGTDQPVKTTYTGKMSASGDEIAFTVTGGRGGGMGGLGGPPPAAAGAGRGGTRGAQPPTGQPGAAQPPAGAPGGPNPSAGQQMVARRTR